MLVFICSLTNTGCNTRRKVGVILADSWFCQCDCEAPTSQSRLCDRFLGGKALFLPLPSGKRYLHRRSCRDRRKHWNPPLSQAQPSLRIQLGASHLGWIHGACLAGVPRAKPRRLTHMSLSSLEHLLPPGLWF